MTRTTANSPAAFLLASLLGVFLQAHASQVPTPSTAVGASHAFIGEWRSPAYRYAFRIKGRIGIATQSNAPRVYRVGDTILRIAKIAPGRFEGHQMFTSGQWVPVIGELTGTNVMRMRGGGHVWTMIRKKQNKAEPESGYGSKTVAPRNATFAQDLRKALVKAGVSQPVSYALADIVEKIVVALPNGAVKNFLTGPEGRTLLIASAIKKSTIFSASNPEGLARLVTQVHFIEGLAVDVIVNVVDSKFGVLAGQAVRDVHIAFGVATGNVIGATAEATVNTVQRLYQVGVATWGYYKDKQAQKEAERQGKLLSLLRDLRSAYRDGHSSMSEAERTAILDMMKTVATDYGGPAFAQKFVSDTVRPTSTQPVVIGANPFGVTFRITTCTPLRRQTHQLQGHKTYRVVRGDVPRGIDLTNETVVKKLLLYAENLVWNQCPALQAPMSRLLQAEPYLANVEVQLFQAGEQLVTAKSYYRDMFRQQDKQWLYTNLAVRRKKQAEEAERKRQAELAQQARQKQARLEAERAQQRTQNEARAEFEKWYPGHEKALAKSPYGQVGAVTRFLEGLRDKNFQKLFETEDLFRRTVIGLREDNPTTLRKRAIFNYYWQEKTNHEGLQPGSGQHLMMMNDHVYAQLLRYVPPWTTWNVVETKRIFIRRDLILGRAASPGLAVYVKLSYASPGAKLSTGRKLREAVVEFAVNDAGYIVACAVLPAGLVYW